MVSKTCIMKKCVLRNLWVGQIEITHWQNRCTLWEKSHTISNDKTKRSILNSFRCDMKHMLQTRNLKSSTKLKGVCTTDANQIQDVNENKDQSFARFTPKVNPKIYFQCYSDGESGRDRRRLCEQWALDTAYLREQRNEQLSRNVSIKCWIFE